jgi:hypothetical protein
MVPLSPLYGPQYVSRTALLATVTHPQTMDEADIVTSPSRGYIAPLPPRLPLAPPPPPLVVSSARPVRQCSAGRCRRPYAYLLTPLRISAYAPPPGGSAAHPIRHCSAEQCQRPCAHLLASPRWLSSAPTCAHLLAPSPGGSAAHPIRQCSTRLPRKEIRETSGAESRWSLQLSLAIAVSFSYPGSSITHFAVQSRHSPSCYWCHPPPSRSPDAVAPQYRLEMAKVK